jgi:hypothetical protein
MVTLSRYVPALTTIVSPREPASTAAWIDPPGWTTCVAARADAGDPNVNPAITTPAKAKALLSNWRMAPPSFQINRRRTHICETKVNALVAQSLDGDTR